MQNLNPNYQGTTIFGKEAIDTNNVIRHIMTVAALVAPVHTVMFLTSTHWGQLIDAVKKHAPAAPGLTDDRFKRSLVVGNDCTCCKPARPYLEVRNSGSEDQDAVDMANDKAAELSGFAWKRDAWRVG